MSSPDAGGATLRAADQTAQQQMSGQDIAQAVQTCPKSPRFALEALVVGEDGAALADVAVELRNGAQLVMRTKTGANGMARFTGLEALPYRLSLYQLDQEAWALRSESALAPAPAGAAAQWVVAEPTPARAEFVHTVVQGECAAKVAYRFGFFVDTVWNWPANAGLAKLRESKYLLLPADRLVVPGLRQEWIPCVTGMRYELLRKGVPEKLNIQFKIGGVARAHAAYFLELRTLGGQVLKHQSGRTTADGRVKAWVPPDTTEAAIRITQHGDTDDYLFAIGSLDPADEDSGAAARLASLGYGAWSDGQEPKERLAQAARHFQQANGLAPSGQLDADTKSALGTAYVEGS